MGMKTIKFVRLAPVFIAAFAWCFSSAAVSTVAIYRTGPTNFYKGSCAFGATTFTITANPAPTSQIEVYVYFGGNGDGSCPTDPCLAKTTNNCDSSPGDFNVSGTGLSVVRVVANLYEVVIPAGHTSVVITAQALTNSSACDDRSTVIANIPSTEDYTDDEYDVDPDASSAVAYLYQQAQAPSITVSVAFNNSPPYLYKSTHNTISFTLTASAPFPASKLVVFFAGGDGTASNNTDPCNAVYPTDFTVSGANTAPFPNGFDVIFNEGDTSKTVTLTGAGSGYGGCENGYQTLLVTIPSNGSCPGYTPGSPAQITGYVYP